MAIAASGAPFAPALELTFKFTTCMHLCDFIMIVPATNLYPGLCMYVRACECVRTLAKESNHTVTLNSMVNFMDSFLNL